MKKLFSIILILIGTLSFSQENKLEMIDNTVNSIETDTNIIMSEFDWVELTGIATDGGGIFKVEIYVFDWKNDDEKIVRTGKRNMSEGNCSTFDYEPIIKRTKKAVKK